MKSKLITSARNKNIAQPKTVKEKYDKLAQKNPAIEKLKDAFDLGLSL